MNERQYKKEARLYRAMVRALNGKRSSHRRKERHYSRHYHKVYDRFEANVQRAAFNELTAMGF